MNFYSHHRKIGKKAILKDILLSKKYICDTIYSW